ncbi:MAG: 30S ribosome-binding factor RbfA [bacterium]|nr:30S ribosome-binding factor RbfA [bacterium]
MQPFHRHQRVESLIMEELNKILLKEMEFPTGTLVTITSVEAQKDLEYALINVSVLPTQNSNEVLEMLTKRQKYLQHLLLEKIHIKPMPEIRFRIDYGLENAAELEKTFIEIEKQEKSD